MSGVYFITPYDPKDWEQQNQERVPSIFKIDVSSFEKELRTQWADAEIRYDFSDSQILAYWSLTPKQIETSLIGSIFSDYETITIEIGVEQNLVEFIKWYRLFIPSEYNLFLFTDSSFERLELTLNTTVNEVGMFISRH